MTIEGFRRIGFVLIVLSSLLPVGTLVVAWLCAEFWRIPIQNWVVVLAFCGGYVFAALGALAQVDVCRQQRAEIERLNERLDRLSMRGLQ